MRGEQALRKVAIEFENRLDQLVQRLERRHRQEIVPLRDLEAPELWEDYRLAVRESRRVQASYLTRGMALPGACPEPDVHAARMAAAGGLSLGDCIQCYWTGHAVTVDVWLEALESLDLPEPQHAECLSLITRFTNAYQERIADLVAGEYARELEEISRHPDKKRFALIRDLINGSTDSLNGLEYDLELEHLGVIAWGRDSRSILRELAATLERRLLWAPAEDDLLMAWLGSKAQLHAEGLTLVRGFSPAGEGKIAIGSPAAGLDGFRRTHRQAGEAHVVACRTTQPVTLYRDVSLEAFALRDEPAARDFVSYALELLRPNGTDLSETLRAYFAAGQNASSAAAALDIHEHTVTRRIQKVEERLGCPVNARRGELELALRLEPLLQ